MPTPFVGRTSTSRERPLMDRSCIHYYYSYLTLTRVQWSGSPRLLQQTVPLPPSHIPNTPCSPQRQSNPSIHPSCIQYIQLYSYICTQIDCTSLHHTQLTVLVVLAHKTLHGFATPRLRFTRSLAQWFRYARPLPLSPHPSA